MPAEVSMSSNARTASLFRPIAPACKPQTASICPVHFFVASDYVCQFGLGTLTSKGAVMRLNDGQE